MPTQTFMNLSDEKKNKILLAAKKEFTRVPLSEASINNIITDAEIPRGSFYQYFISKQDLLEYLIEKVDERTTEILRDKLQEEGNIFDAFISFYDNIIKASKSESDREFYKTFFKNSKPNDGMVFGLNKHKMELMNFMLENTDTSDFKKKEDLKVVIDMLKAVTKLAIIQTVSTEDYTSSRENFLKQIDYIKFGVLRKERQC